MKAYEHITDAQSELIARQHMFFVATAPLADDGHVNLSPKGLDCHSGEVFQMSPVCLSIPVLFKRFFG